MIKNTPPFYTVVTPVWNRERFIERCIHSVLSQTFEDFEYIIVDDFSTDGTSDIVKKIKDDRIKLIQHKENMGVCAARNTGTEAATGQWILTLDSDWMLDPNALEKLYAVIQSVSDDVGVVGAMIRTDMGVKWPGAVPPQVPMNLVELMRWKEACHCGGATDYLQCRRKIIFKEFHWPTKRVLEGRIHWEIAQKWKTYVIDEILATQYLSVENSISRTRSLSVYKKRALFAKERFGYEVETIEIFGGLLQTHAPSIYRARLFDAVYWSFLAGKRSIGYRYWRKLYYIQPSKLKSYGLLISGLIGPSFMVIANYLRSLLSKINL